MEKEDEDKCRGDSSSISLSMPSSPHLRDNKVEANAEKTEARASAMNPVYDKRFDSFKTWSGQLPNLSESEQIELEILPVHRYLDALEGPELDTLRVCTNMHGYNNSILYVK